MSTSVHQRIADVADAITTIPTAAAWRRCLWIYVAFLACAIPVGLTSGLVHLAPAPTTAAGSALLACTLLLHPALTEEIVFRALLLPRRPERLRPATVAALVVIALVLYVGAHPLNAWLFWPAAMPVFTDASYLGLVTLLGAACTAAYLVSQSIWPPVLIHWVTVTAWILLLGGAMVLRSR